MEALVLLFGEFLFFLFGGLLVIMAEGVLLLFSSAFYWFGWRAKNRREDQDPIDAPPVPVEKPLVIKRKLPKWMAVAQRGLIIVLAITLVAAFLINTIFFESALRKITEAVGKRTGLELTFADATGSFLPGHMQLSDVVLQKGRGSGSCIDFSIKKMAVKFNLFALLGTTAEIDFLEIEELRGIFSRTYNPSAAEEASPAKRVEARKRFIIETLRMSKSSLVVVDESREGKACTLPITIDQLDVIPLRSSFAVFDILFRANAHGTLSGQPFSIQTQLVTGGRSTKWHAENLPVELLSHYIGRPFNLLQQGVVDVDVEDSWSLGRQTDIDTHWKLEFRDVVAAVPENTEPWANVAAEPVVDYINTHGVHLPISFDFTMNENEFRGAASLHASGLFKEISRAFIKEMARRLDIYSGELKDGVSSGFSRFKSFLDEKRKNTTPQLD